jgi:ParB-like chromosome segregation protein Spo0J
MVNTIDRPAEAVTGTLLMLDPRALLADERNERGEITLESDPELAGLVESIRENGIVEPIRIYATPRGTVISSGHRRRAAAIIVAGTCALSPCACSRLFARRG